MQSSPTKIGKPDGHGAVDWPAVVEHLQARGSAVIPQLLDRAQCLAMKQLYPQASNFRKRVVMENHGYGQGEYQYFSYPLPPFVQQLRSTLYTHLVGTANLWNEAMRVDVRYPQTHAQFLGRCHAAGQLKPTPLLLQYAEGGYNCLHQDLYGEHVFPIQAVVLLSQPGEDFTGGEFVLTEQRPRMQSRAEVMHLQQGDAVLFAVHHRPVRGSRGFYRVNMRHGVSTLRSGCRHTLGVIFHDAQ